MVNVWEQRKLKDLIIEYKETVDSNCTLPVLTSSKSEGVVLQEEHFGRKQNHDIEGYNVLPRNYCTYRNRSDGVDFTFNINKCCDKGIDDENGIKYFRVDKMINIKILDEQRTGKDGKVSFLVPMINNYWTIGNKNLRSQITKNRTIDSSVMKQTFRWIFNTSPIRAGVLGDSTNLVNRGASVY